MKHFIAYILCMLPLHLIAETSVGVRYSHQFHNRELNFNTLLVLQKLNESSECSSNTLTTTTGESIIGTSNPSEDYANMITYSGKMAEIEAEIKAAKREQSIRGKLNGKDSHRLKLANQRLKSLKRKKPKFPYVAYLTEVNTSSNSNTFIVKKIKLTFPKIDADPITELISTKTYPKDTLDSNSKYCLDRPIIDDLSKCYFTGDKTAENSCGNKVICTPKYLQHRSDNSIEVSVNDKFCRPEACVTKNAYYCALDGIESTGEYEIRKNSSDSSQGNQ